MVWPLVTVSPTLTGMEVQWAYSCLLYTSIARIYKTEYPYSCPTPHGVGGLKFNRVVLALGHALPHPLVQEVGAHPQKPEGDELSLIHISKS